MRQLVRLSLILLVGTSWSGARGHPDEPSRWGELQALRGCKDVAGTPVGVTDIRCEAGRQRIKLLSYGSAERICTPQPSSDVQCDHGEPLSMQLLSGQHICVCVVSQLRGMPPSLAVGVPAAGAVVSGTVAQPEDAARILQVAEAVAESKKHQR